MSTQLVNKKHMKYIKHLFLIILLIPHITFGAIGVGWNATSTDKGFISPNAVNGNLPGITVSGNSGFGTTSPFKLFSVVGDEWHNGSYYHFGPSVSNALNACGTANCFEWVGSDNTTAGWLLGIQNINPGTAAYSGLNFFNDAGGTVTTGYAGIYITSTNYNDPTFGTAFAVPSQLQVQSAIGPISIGTATTTASANYISFLTGGFNTSNERMRIVNSGQVGIGTSTPGDNFVVQGASGANTVMNIVASGTGNTGEIRLTKDGVSGTGFTFKRYGSAIGSGLNNTGEFWNFESTGNSGIRVGGSGGELARFDTINTRLGIGTTTPQWLLNPVSATLPQLSLGEGAGSSQWTFRNAGGNLYLSTTTVAGTATTSVAALTIGNLGDVTTRSGADVTSLTVTGGALTTAIPFESHTGTWNNAGVTFTGMFMNYTATAASATSLIADFRINNTSQLTIRRDGVLLVGASGEYRTTAASYMAAGVRSGSASNISFGAAGVSGSSSAEITVTGTTATTNAGTIQFRPGLASVAQQAELARFTSAGNFLIGTSSASAPGLAVFATSSVSNTFKPQLVLTDTNAGTNLKHWAFASEGGNLYIATSTDLYATTSISALTIDSNGHHIVSGAKPTCDANCTFVAGNDNAFRVKLGTTVTTSTITFGASWGTVAPICLANEGDAGTVTVNASSTPTTVVLTSLSLLTAKDVDVQCVGINN